jgi:large subunit ribosomal protein L25
MSRPTISARPRDARGKAVAKLRRSGMLPGVVYGAGLESQAIEFDAREFESLRRSAGRNAVLDLTVEGNGTAQPVLLHAIQEHPVTRLTLHVDLLAVNLQEERTVDVKIVITGESEAVDRLGGVLLHLRDAVAIRAKPDDLPSGIELDVTPLVDFDAVLHASDLRIPAGVTLVTDPSESIARVQPPRIEEEPVVAAEEAEEAEGEEAEAAAEAASGEGGQPAAEGEAAPETGTEESA